jgi:hypothetical protein
LLLVSGDLIRIISIWWMAISTSVGGTCPHNNSRRAGSARGFSPLKFLRRVRCDQQKLGRSLNQKIWSGVECRLWRLLKNVHSPGPTFVQQKMSLSLRRIQRQQRHSERPWLVKSSSTPHSHVRTVIDPAFWRGQVSIACSGVVVG